MATTTIPNISGFTVEFIRGDITQTPASCIVNSVGRELNLYTAGALSNNIAQNGGPTIQNDCSQDMANFQNEGVIITSSGNLTNCQFILHINNRGVRGELRDRIVKALTKADQYHLTDIAFPALGSGGIGHSPRNMAVEFLVAMTVYDSAVPAGVRTLCTVKFVFEDNHAFDAYLTVFRAVLNGRQQGGNAQDGGGQGNSQVTLSSLLGHLGSPRAASTPGSVGFLSTTTTGTAPSSYAVAQGSVGSSSTPRTGTAPNRPASNAAAQGSTVMRAGVAGAALSTSSNGLNASTAANRSGTAGSAPTNNTSGSNGGSGSASSNSSQDGSGSGRSSGSVGYVLGRDPQASSRNPINSSQGHSQCDCGLKQSALATFQCKICLEVIRPPTIMCNHCRQLIGCNHCVAQAVLSSTRCPYCRAQWSTNGQDVQEFIGINEFLQNLRVFETNPTE